MDGSISTPWWRASKDEVHKEIFAFIDNNSLNQSTREVDFLTYLRLYGSQSHSGFTPNKYNTNSPTETKFKITLNVINSMCDTIVSKLSKNKPRPMFLTDGGDYSIQKQAENLNRFCQGQFYQTKIYEKAPTMLLDATVFGTGALKIFRVEDKIHVERVLPHELSVDDAEAIYGEPRQLHQTKYIHKDVLKANTLNLLLRLKLPQQQLPVIGGCRSKIPSWLKSSNRGA